MSRDFNHNKKYGWCTENNIRLVSEAIRSLPEILRCILVARVYLYMTVSEIADMFGISENDICYGVFFALLLIDDYLLSIGANNRSVFDKPRKSLLRAAIIRVEREKLKILLKTSLPLPKEKQQERRRKRRSIQGFR